ncbi:hypothetical protein [Rarobacter incanus]|nr:hypothetical protein [Rarobacter incanus]
MTNYPPPQYGTPPPFAGPQAPPKTATGAGKVLTFIGIALTLVCIGLIAVIMVNVTGMPKEIRSGAVADYDNGYTANGLRSGRTYVVFPSVSSSTSYERGGGESSWSSYNASNLGIILVDSSSDAELPVAKADFATLGGIIQEVLTPLGQFTASSDGRVDVYFESSIDPPAGFELAFVDQSTVDGIAAKARTAFIALIGTIVVGFFASIFLIWGIILWAVRASRKRKLEQQARMWGDGPPPAGNWVGPQPPQEGTWGGAPPPAEPQPQPYNE